MVNRWRSLTTTMWSRNSERIERTTRSAMEFARGARKGVRTLAMHGDAVRRLDAILDGSGRMASSGQRDSPIWENSLDLELASEGLDVTAKRR